MKPSPAESGAIALGPFDLFEPIARGGMGEVWRGRHRRSELPVAVKVITRRRGSAARFRNEIRSAARLSHPNVVLVFDQDQIDAEASWQSGGRLPIGQPYLAMELATGGTLNEHQLDRRFRRWEDLEAVLFEILGGLAHAHARGVLHRDLKPANVLFAGPGDLRPGLKLSDFGIARAMRANPGREPDAEGRKTVVGTLRYMAPEQIAGRFRDEGPWTDLYALGIIAFQLVSGRPPYGDAGGRDLAHAQLYVPAPPVRPRIPIPEGFQAWLDRLLAKRPEARFELAADARAALDALPPPTIVRLRRARKVTESASPPPAAATGPRHLIGAGLGLWGLRSIPMVGRAAERARLWRLLEDVGADRRARVVLLRGGAGTGKSRLAEDLAERAHQSGAAVVVRAGHSPISGAGGGLRGLVAEALNARGLRRAETYQRALRLIARRPLADDDRGPDPAAERHGAEGSAACHAAQNELDAAALAEIACPEADSDAAADAPRIRFTRPQERYQVVRRLLARLAGDRPVIAWLDDVHFSPDSLRYLIDLAGTADHPILAVATCRAAIGPAEAALVDELCAVDGCEALAVDGLQAGARLELVTQLIGLSSDLAREVAERAEGNPLFAVQLVGDWINRGVLVAGDAGFELAEGASREIPDDIHQLWSERLARLAGQAGAESLAPVELAAALGQQVDHDEWQRASELAGLAPGGRLLDQMLTARFAVDRPGGWEFSHGLVRESLERSAREAGRWAEHHRACAAMLVELYGSDRGPGTSARLGRHLIAAGDLEDAIDHLLDGAEGYRLAGEHAEAHALHDERDAALADLGAGADDRRSIIGRIQRAAIFQQQGRIADAIEALSAAGWAAIEGEHADLVARTETVRGKVHFDMGDPGGARRAYERAIVLFEQTGDTSSLATCLNGLGSMCMWQRELDEAARHLERALELQQRSGDLFELGQTLRVLAHLRHCERDWDRAAELCQRARSCFDHCGCPLEVANCINDLGELARARGLLDDAELRYREAAQIYATLGAPSLMTAHYNLGLVLLGRGEIDAAEAIFSSELAALAGSPRSVDRLWLRAGLLACAAANRDWDAWEEHVERVEALLDGSGFVDDDIAELSVVTGRLTAAAGQPARARRIYEIARSQLARMKHADRLAEVEQAISAL